MPQIAKPTRLKVLEGNPGKQRINRAEPVAAGKPVKPTGLDAYALTVWRRLLRSMPPGVYGACDSDLLAAYCGAASRLRAANQHIAIEGAVVTIDGEPKRSPWVMVANTAAAQLVSIGARLGLDPIARRHIEAPPSQTPSKWAGLVPGFE